MNEPAYLGSPFLILLLIAGTVFLAEATVMLLFYFVPMESQLLEGFVDAAMLVTIISPALYYLVFRPIVIHMRYRERLENVLLENKEEQFKVMLRTSLDGFCMTDLQGRFMEVNDSYCRLMAYSRDELLSMRVSDIEVEGISGEVSRRIDELNQNGRVSFETCYRNKYGSILNVEVSCNVNTVGSKSIYCFLRDVTERKKFEEQLSISAIAFESNESLMITDSSEIILRVNKSFTESTGYTAKECVGQTPRMLKSGRHDKAFYAAMWDSINRTGTWQGEVWDRRKSGQVYPKWLTITAVKGTGGKVTHYVGTHVDITERKAAEDKIQSLALYDTLTDLPNRRLLLDMLRQSFASGARSKRTCALMFIDLDNFKTLNDTQGHDIGDLLLQQVAKRLKSCVRESDTVARLGGDEFVVVLACMAGNPVEAAENAEIVGRKIHTALSQPYQLAMHEYRCTASIGIALANDLKLPIDELMKQADIAMYESKKAGRNTLRFFDQQMQKSVNARAAIESELRQALDKGQFQLYYQSQVTSSRKVFGAEALIRWVHPERGMVSPAQFIPLAEETGLILPIGQWVVETACTQLKGWAKNILTRNLVLAVNVSARQFRQPDFVANIQATVLHHAINPNLLKLELTESLTLENIEDTIAKMNALNEIGVQLALDDFGTGYSSLQYLKRLPLDQLKIDQSFVRDIATGKNDKAIVNTIIAMARSLNLDVIAEGVETEAQRQFLLENGCNHYQGYLFSKPVPIDQFDVLLESN